MLKYIKIQQDGNAAVPAPKTRGSALCRKERTDVADYKDNIGKILLTEREIQEKIKELGARITADYSGKKLLVIGILKGSFVFMADLIRAIETDVRVDFMAVSSYGAGTVSGGTLDIRMDLKQMDVLIAEDILDSGNTLCKVRRMLLKRGPASLRIAALLDKPSRREADVQVDYTGFEIPDEFVVGYGLDFDENYRGLPYVGVLKPEAYQ